MEKRNQSYNNLSKEQKIKLIEASREKKRRARAKKRGYMPHPEQLDVIKCKARNVNLFCGNGWGKTTTGAHIAMWLADGYNPITKEYSKVPTVVTIVLDHPTKVEDTWLPEMRKWFVIEDKYLAKNGKPYYNEIKRRNGSVIKFMFHEQPELVFESTQFRTVLFDEPPPRKIFVAMKRGQRERNIEHQTYILGTPIYQAWMRSEIYEPWKRGEIDNTECFFGSTDANRANLSDEWYDDFTQFLSEEEKEVRLRGMFFNSSQLALKHLWERESHIISWEKFLQVWDSNCPCVVAIDPHPTKKHHACLVGAGKDGRLYYIKEMAAKEVARDFARTLKEFYRGYRVLDIVVDSLGSADGTGNDDFKSFIGVLNEEGVRARATSYKEKSDEDFIDKLRTVLGVPKDPDNYGFYVPKLRVVEGCDGVVKDIENVQWQRNKQLNIMKPKLEISDTDYLACLKYALASGISYRKSGNKPKSYISKKSSMYGLRR